MADLSDDLHPLAADTLAVLEDIDTDAHEIADKYDPKLIKDMKDVITHFLARFGLQHIAEPGGVLAGTAAPTSSENDA
jgi:hypothetical protein